MNSILHLQALWSTPKHTLGPTLEGEVNDVRVSTGCGELVRSSPGQSPQPSSPGDLLAWEDPEAEPSASAMQDSRLATAEYVPESPT